MFTDCFGVSFIVKKKYYEYTTLRWCLKEIVYQPVVNIHVCLSKNLISTIALSLCLDVRKLKFCTCEPHLNTFSTWKNNSPIVTVFISYMVNLCCWSDEKKYFSLENKREKLLVGFFAHSKFEYPLRESQRHLFIQSLIRTL